MPATPEQWQNALMTTLGHCQDALVIVRAMQTGKATLVGLPDGDERYHSAASAKQLNDAGRDMMASVNAAIEALRAAKAL